MSIESHLRAWLRSLELRLQRWRLTRALDRRIASEEEEIGRLEELIEGARKRFRRKADAAAFRRTMEEGLTSVHGIGPTLASRILAHPLMEDAAAFRASVHPVKGVGPGRRERLLAWEEGTRGRRVERAAALMEEGGLDRPLEGEIAELRAELAKLRAIVARLRELRGEIG